MNLLPPIQAYFDAHRRGDEAALVRSFSPDALVVDEGHTHVGHEAIGAWWRESKAKYQPVLEPLESIAQGEGETVRASVSGDFPGSPAILSFAFRLAGDRIARLEIGA